MEPQGDFCILRRIVAEQGFHYREIRLLMVIPQGKALQNARVHILLGPDFGGMFLEPGCKVWNCPLSPAAQALFEELPVLFSYPEMAEQLPAGGIQTQQQTFGGLAQKGAQHVQAAFRIHGIKHREKFCADDLSGFPFSFFLLLVLSAWA